MDTLWFSSPSPLVYKRFPTEIKSFQLFHNNTLKHIHSQSVGFSVVGYQQRGRHVQALGISKLDAETQAMNQTPICEDLCTSVIGLSDTIVGVLGGGQLGRMLCQAASKMGVKVAVLDPMENCPASAIAHRHVVGSFRDTNAVQKFAIECGVITVEIEHVDVGTLDVLEKQGMDCQPNASTIQLIQDKYMQKVHFREHNVPLPDFMQIDCFESAKIAGDMFSYPLMIKSRRLAYDGRGNAVANCEEDISTAVSALGGFERGLYAEKWAPFIKELAVIVARGRDGTVCCFPVVETTHKDSICHMVEAPADVSTEVREMAVQVAKRAVSSLKGAGVFAVELFLTGDGQILLNEIAPRPHNSGHHTIEACYVSQFEQHLRAILGLPLGDASMKVPAAIMYNLLGEDEGEKGFFKAHQLMKRAVSVAGASVHWYEKPEMRKQRKMGHITVVGSSMDLVRAWMKLIVDGETQDRSLSSRSTQPLENSSKVSAAASSGNDNSGYGARAWKRWGSGTQRTQKTTTRPVISGPGPEVGIIMGSDSDLPVMKAAAEILKSFNVSYEITIVSAHRTPDRMAEYAKEARGRGIKVIIAGAGGAAHLPGMTASMTTLPVLGVPIRGSFLDGMDSLPSIVQMPKGIPVATFAIQNATNAALFAAQILAIIDANLHERLSNYQIEMKETVIKEERFETIGWEPQRTHASIINRSLHGSPEVGIIMGSDSDLPVMTAAAEILKSFNVSYEITIESAHQTPDRMAEYAKEAHGKGIKVIIVGAGGAAHLPGMIASLTTLTVLGVPVKGSSLDEMDSLLSIVQMREGVPVATFAIQNATNAALFAVRILALINANLHERLSNYQIEMEETVIKKAERLETIGYEAYLS